MSDAALSRVGVVVVAYASASTLRDCLEPLPRSSLAGVVVVDNDSPDDSAAVAASVDGVRVVHRPNLGFGAGCNAGAAELVGAELLLFLNPDAAIEQEDLLKLVAHLERQPSCAVVAPRLFRGTEPLPSWGYEAGMLSELRPVAPAAVARRLPRRRAEAKQLPSGPVGYVEGACFLVRTDALAEVGGFDERFFLFFEELDLARRLRARGWSVELCADAHAQHQSAVSRRALDDGGRTHMLRSSVLYLSGLGPARVRAFVLLAVTSLWLRSRIGGLDRAAADRAIDAVRRAAR